MDKIGEPSKQEQKRSKEIVVPIQIWRRLFGLVRSEQGTPTCGCARTWVVRFHTPLKHKRRKVIFQRKGADFIQSLFSPHKRGNKSK